MPSTRRHVGRAQRASLRVTTSVWVLPRPTSPPYRKYHTRRAQLSLPISLSRALLAVCVRAHHLTPILRVSVSLSPASVLHSDTLLPPWASVATC